MTIYFSPLTALTLGCLIIQLVAEGWAQDYPSKPIRYILPASPGGGFDTIGRIVAAGLGEVLGQQVFVENRAGAGGNIGAEAAARAPADGYTIVQVSLTHAVNASLYRNLAYDLVRDFSPVTQLASSPSIVLVHPSLPVRSLAELVRLAKSRPGAINYASAGSGTSTFLSTELFKNQAGVDLLHVPYRGGGEALTSIISGETSVYFSPVASALPHIRSGKLRPLAVTTARRLPSLAEYPTVAEAGYPGSESGSWYGLLVPVKTPKERIATIRNAAIAVLHKPVVSKRLSDLGYILIGDQPEEFAAHIKSEIAKLGKIIQQTGATVN